MQNKTSGNGDIGNKEDDGKGKESIVMAMPQSSLKTVNAKLCGLSTAAIRLKIVKEARSLLEKINKNKHR